MAHARVNAAAIRIKPADDHVVDPDERSQNAHRGDQPERRVAADRERQADDVRFAGAPVPVQNRGRARDVDVARSLNVSCDQFASTPNRSGVVRRRGPTSARAGIGPGPCTLMTLTRLAVGLEPSNALDAAHRSPRSIPPQRNEGWVPRWTRTRESIKQNKELAGYSGVLFHRSRNLARR